MQGAGMLRVRTGTILCLFVLTIGHVCGMPLQVLPSIPGYIPVYIRHGDEPLIEINPALAEAFHETEDYSKTVRNMQLDRDPDQEASNEKSKPSKSERPILEDKVSEKPEKAILSNVVDSQSNDDINKIEFKDNVNENEKSNIMKISKVSQAGKDDLKKITVAVEKEETRPNDLYDTTSKISAEPEEVQFIKVSILSDPLDIPIVRRTKSVKSNEGEPKDSSK